ncbi:PREDICTED: cleavage stimulation factor subunit 2 tau variant-like [Nicrophorus vespilloides]|uniref:Cleavage stimulation factor subunit 2 tau variant-like n=1 Tax=Nicrophorus vespilloides TaxID=110193 RepID=A0ABM1M4F8_NICVS|nr:PREDICTED: cleavage stimulation factor subunit 2 tau variant-like [Nicrophorus vespilloides]
MDILDANIMDKSMRSVFVGNIPYEATEEKLKDIFGEAGQVLSFKLVFDRETGKPRGYGFCEYSDQETALSAMRNLNGYEIGGRFLRVDNACTEKSRMEMQNLMNQPTEENPYGEAIDAEKAPEVISKVVTSLPPEQMMELMRQMRTCIRNNPDEARTMLLQNPQLSYALLQAQVVMKIIDPEVACSMLHAQGPTPPTLKVPEASTAASGSSTPVVAPVAPVQTKKPSSHHGSKQQSSSKDYDMRAKDSRHGDPRAKVADVRPTPTPVQPPITDAYGRDPRMNYHEERIQPRVDPRMRHMRPVNSAPSLSEKRPSPGPAPPPPSMNMGMPMNFAVSGATDQEKTALIMQVLQLSDEQIAMLPPQQRSSILVLKEQIANSTQH